MRTHIPFHLPIPHTSRGRHLLEALVIVVLVVLAALGLAYWLTRPAQPVSVITTPAADPAVPGVMNYIRVHASIPAHAPAAPLDLDDRYPLPNLGIQDATPMSIDPAAQSVMSYIQVHRAVESTTVAPIDPATQSVLDYIRRHASLRSAAPAVDPATQSVLDYLRVHGN